MKKRKWIIATQDDLADHTGFMTTTVENRTTNTRKGEAHRQAMWPEGCRVVIDPDTGDELLAVPEELWPTLEDMNTRKTRDDKKKLW